MLPDGGRVHFVRTSGGAGYVSAVMEHTETPSGFFKATLRWNNARAVWDLTRTDGVVYEFGTAGTGVRLIGIVDRSGNRLRIERSRRTHRQLRHFVTRDESQTMIARTANSPNAFFLLLAFLTAVIAGACTVGPYQAVSNETPYSTQIGAEYRVIADDLYAYGVYASVTDKRDGKPISSITLIPGVGIGGSEIAWKKAIPRGRIVRILSAWRPALPFGDQSYYRVAVDGAELPAEIPVEVYLYNDNRGSGVDLNPEVYSRIDQKQ